MITLISRNAKDMATERLEQLNYERQEIRCNHRIDEETKNILMKEIIEDRATIIRFLKEIKEDD